MKNKKLLKGKFINLLVIGHSINSKESDSNHTLTVISEKILFKNSSPQKSLTLLHYILKNIDHKNFEFHLIPEKTIKDLKISKTTLYYWKKDLLDSGIIEKISTNIYRLKAYSLLKCCVSEKYNDNDIYDNDLNNIDILKNIAENLGYLLIPKEKLLFLFFDFLSLLTKHEISRHEKNSLKEELDFNLNSFLSEKNTSDELVKEYLYKLMKSYIDIKSKKGGNKNETEEFQSKK